METRHESEWTLGGFWASSGAFSSNTRASRGSHPWHKKPGMGFNLDLEAGVSTSAWSWGDSGAGVTRLASSVQLSRVETGADTEGERVEPIRKADQRSRVPSVGACRVGSSRGDGSRVERREMG